MKKISRQMTNNIIWGSILPVLFVLGIILIVTNQSNIFGINGTICIIIGVVFVVLGFYGTPMIWVGYGEKVTCKRILNLIINENLYSISDIASQMGMQENMALKTVRYLINKEYLTGYLLIDNTYLKLNENVKQVKGKTIVKCPSCGAKNVLDGETGTCQYCGDFLRRN